MPTQNEYTQRWNKSCCDMEGLKSLKDYEDYFTKLVKECTPDLFWEHMKGRPIMQIVAAALIEAIDTLRQHGKIQGRCEICGAVIDDTNLACIWRERVRVKDAASGENFTLDGILHIRCKEHYEQNLPREIEREHLTFTDLTHLAWFVEYSNRQGAKKHLIAAMKNCIAGLEKDMDG